MHSKKFFLIAICITFTVFLVPAASVIKFDPFYQFHKKYAPVMGFDGNDRYQNAGLIKSWLGDKDEHINTVIIGTSMSQNLTVSDLKNDHGVSALKLTMGGGSAKELSIIANKAIATGNVQRIIWEVYSTYLIDDHDFRHAKSPLPEFLYNGRAFDQWRYIFNHDIFEDAIKVAIKKTKKRKIDLDDIYTWEDKNRFIKFASEKNIEILKARLGKADLPLEKKYAELNYTFPNIDKNLLPIIKKNPDIEFDIFFPPVSYFAYAAEGNKGRFWALMAMRRYVLQELDNQGNVTVFGFDLIDSHSSKISNFRDYHHYSPKISKYMTEAIANKTHQISYDNWPKYESKLVSNINKFTKDFLKD